MDALRCRWFALVLLAGALAAFAAIAAPARASSDTLRVWFASETPTPPFRDWRRAAHTIQEAVDRALPGDCVLIKADSSRAYTGSQSRCLFACSSPASSPTIAVVFPKSGVSIIGEEPGPLPILSGGDSVRTIAFRDSTFGASVERIRIRDGGVLFYGYFDTTSVVRRCVIESCRQMEGGGMRIVGDAAPLIEENLFVGNQTDSTLHHRNAGALAVNGSFPPPRAQIRRNIFRGNRAWNMGGAIRVKYGAPYIEGNLFEFNRAGGDGGAIAIQGGKPRIFGNTFRGNHAGGFGGAIATIRSVDSQGLNVHDNVFEADSAAAGGAIELSGRGTQPSQYKVFNNSFIRCHAESAGAALFLCGTLSGKHAVWVNRNLFVGVPGRSMPLLECDVSGDGASIDSLVCNGFLVEGDADGVSGPSCTMGAVGGNVFRSLALIPPGAVDSTSVDALRAIGRPDCDGEIGAR